MIRDFTPLFIFSFLVFFMNATLAQDAPFLSAELNRHTLFLNNGQQNYQLDSLEIGKEYHLQITDISYADICLPFLKNEIGQQVLRQTEYYTLLQFRATSVSVSLDLAMTCLPMDIRSKEFWLTVECKNCLPKSQSRSNMGIQVQQNDDAEYLIRDVFLGGNCFDVENITSSGVGSQFGVFSNATLGTGIVDHGLFNSQVDLLTGQEGIIMSTGLATDARGPNASVKTGKGVNSGKSDRDLARLIGTGNIHDAVALEFDFTPTVEEVSFEYVFASEEYCEYVGTSFNDVFGFFISGPGINGTFSDGAINIATLPNSNEYVSINSVNFEATDEYYIKNARPFSALGCQERFGGKPIENLIEYDGLTTMLTAVAKVIPCETYHIKLIIGDVSDGIYDSAVLLKANSFMAGGNVTASINIPGAIETTSTTAIEGCQNASIVFQRTDDDTSEPFEVTYQIADSSTAIAGEDYLPFGTSVTIPSGQMSVELPIVTIDDNKEEPVESIYLLMDQACSCKAKEVELQIAEPPPFKATFEEVSICEGGQVFLSPDLEGGLGRIEYEWSNGKKSISIRETINQETAYTVTVTDQCDLSTEASLIVTIDEPTAIIQGAAKICNGERQGTIDLDLSGTGPWNLTYTRDGEEQPVIEVLESPYLLQDSIAGKYEIITAEGGGCVAEGTGEAELQVSEISIDFTTQNPSCFNTEDGGITTTIGGSGQDLQYAWTNESTDKNIFDLAVGFYSLSVMDNLNCVATADSIELIAPPAITAAITAEEKINCYQAFITEPEIEIAGGTPGYTQNILNTLTGELVEKDRIGAGNFLVKVTDAMGCNLEELFTVEADTIQPNAAAGGKDNLSCKVEATNLSGVGSSEGADIAYLWTTTDGHLQSGETTLTPIVDKPGTYDLIVTNLANGCQTRASDTILGNYTQPDFTVEQPEELNCQVKELSLQGIVASPVADYSLEWTTDDGNFSGIPNSLTAKVDDQGTYNLIVIDEENGCKDTVSVAVMKNTTAPSIILPDNYALTCTKQAVTLDARVAGLNKEDFGFSWNFQVPEAGVTNRNDLPLVVSLPGTYELTVNDLSNFCVSTKMTRVLMDTLPPMAEAGTSFIFTCDLETANLEGQAVNEDTYRWTTTDGAIESNAESLSPTISRAGQYELEVISSTNGCIAIDRVSILEDPNRPEAIIAPPANLTCLNQMVPLNADASSAGVMMDYRWSTVDGTLVNTDDPIRPLVSEAGTYMLQITNTESSCIGRREVTVALDTIAPVANIRPSKSFDCHIEAMQLDATGSSKGADFIYAWNTTDGTIQEGGTTLFPTISEPGNYTLLITSNINGCTKDQSLLVEENVPRSLSVEKIDPPCPNETGFIQINEVQGGVGPYRYSINGGSTYQDAQGFDRVPAGNYAISIMDDNGCELQEQVNIVAPAPLELKLDPEVAIELGDSTTLNLLTNIPDNQIADIVWTPAIGLSCDDCRQPMAKPLRSQEYHVKVMDVNGCEIDARTKFLVDANPHIYMPTAFSPNNGDGINDRFTVLAKSSSVRLVKILRIFDRWGNLVFERSNFSPNDLEQGWDGRFNRQQLRPQVFVYFAEVEMIDDRDLMVRGDVALVE